MILFDASFKIPSKNDRPLFISISSNQILANPSRHLLRKPVSSRIDATRSNDSQPLPLEFPWISFSFPARHVHARVHRHTRTYACGDRDCICVGGRGALRSIYLRSSSSLAITKQRRKRARAPSDSHLLPSLFVIFDTVSPLVASVIHRHAKTRGWILWRWNRIWSGGLKEEILF